MNESIELLKGAYDCLLGSPSNEEVILLTDCIRQYLDQPEQEPIAWIMHNKETGYRVQAAYRPSALKKGWEAIPLYAGSPKREPLGDEQLLDERIRQIMTDCISYN